MAAADPGRPARALRLALARAAYRDDRLRLCDGDLRGQYCLIASRQGLFAATPHGAKRIAYGWFFGLCRHDDALFVFEAGDAPGGASRQGRIVRLALVDGRIGDVSVIARGLDNQCHQIAVIGGVLHVVDTAHQAIARFTLDGAALAPLTPFPIVRRDDHGGAYLHLNAIRALGDEIALLLHNGIGPQRPSELAWIDHAGRLRRRAALPGHGCHDIEPDADGLWHCGSLAGELIDPRRRRIKVSDRMTRGLALARDAVVVGTSLFGVREARSALGGSVLFLARDFTRLAEVELPGAPTDLILL
jgi:hypothetical protein